MSTPTKTLRIIALSAVLASPLAAHANDFSDLVRQKTRHTVSDGVATALGQGAAQITYQGVNVVQQGLFSLFGLAPAPMSTHQQPQTQQQPQARQSTATNPAQTSNR